MKTAWGKNGSENALESALEKFRSVLWVSDYTVKPLTKFSQTFSRAFPDTFPDAFPENIPAREKCRGHDSLKIFETKCSARAQDRFPGRLQVLTGAALTWPDLVSGRLRSVIRRDACPSQRSKKRKSVCSAWVGSYYAEA